MIDIYIWQLPMSNPDWCRPGIKEAKYRDYVLVYQRQIDKMPEDVWDYLEKLFEEFNINHPADYHARSMSTSDLIVFVDRENRYKETAFVVDMIGFNQVKLII